MSDGEKTSDPGPPERRLMLRYPAKASTTLIRDGDMMRVGINGELRDVSTTGLGIVVATPLAVNEQFKVSLENYVQRIRKQTRGVVRHVTPTADGAYFVGIELILRLTPLEVSLFKMGIPPASDPDKPVWI